MPPGGVFIALVSVTPKNGFEGSVTVNVSGLPDGSTLSPSTPFTVSSGSQQLTVNFPPTVSQGSVTAAFQAVSGKVQHSANVALQIQQQQLADFSVYLNDKEVSFSRGGGAGTGVGLSLTSSGDTDYEVQFSVSGLPAGVTAVFGANPFLASQPATTLTFSSAQNAGLVNYAPITITALRTADGVQKSAQLTLNVTPTIGTLPAIRSDFVRTDGTPAAAVYDAVHNVVLSSNPQWNRVDVISPTAAQTVSSIPAPSPTAMDMALDGQHLIVGSNLPQIVSIDTSSLRVVQRITVPRQAGGAIQIPGLIANTSNGTALVGMTNFSDPPSFALVQWDPAAGTFTPLAAPGITVWINNLVRTGDGAKVLVVDYGTDQNLAVYDAASNTFTASGVSPTGQILGVAASPTAHHFAVVGTNGSMILDENLGQVAQLPIGGYFFGLVYSADGSKLYVAMELLFSECGPNYPVILTYETTGYTLTGVAPAFAEPTGQSECNPPYYFQANPLAADSSGLVFSTSFRGATFFTEGLVMDDAANVQNLLSLPVGPPYPQVSFTDEAPLNTSLSTGLGQIAYDVLPDVWFGNFRGTNIQSSDPLVTVTAPPSATAGVVNVKAVLPDGWFSIAPQSFSYGSKILWLGGNAGSTQGGSSLAIIGYGLLGSSGSPTVNIGGHAATVTGAAKYRYFVDSGFNFTYPFDFADEVMVTVPAGSPGLADVTVTSSAGTSTLAKAFDYISVSDYATTDTPSYLLYDPQRHWVYLSAGDHIDVFSADKNQYVAPIVPPSVQGSRQLMGLALTPDNSKLLAANFSDDSVAIINPDNPSSAVAVPIPVSVVNAPGVADVVATSNGKAFVDGISATFAGCAGGQLFELDLNTLQVTVRTDANLDIEGNTFSRTGSGKQVLLNGSECGAFLWDETTDQFTPGASGVGSSASSDGYWFSSNYKRLDTRMQQHMDVQLPEFFADLLYYPEWRGQKMNASGSLLYTPVLQGFGTVESNGVEITDTGLGSWLGQVLLSEQIASTIPMPMDYDEAGGRLFLITNKGLTVVQLPPPALSIAYLSPAIGPSAGGTTVIVRGSGFKSGAIVKFGKTVALTTFVDTSTLQVVTPSESSGSARVSIQNPDGTSYALDAEFTYQ